MGGVAISGVGDDHGLRDERPGLLELAVGAASRGKGTALGPLFIW